MKTIVTLVAAAILAGPVFAAEPEHDFAGFVENTARAWFAAPEIHAAIEASNAAHAGMSEEDILAKDAQWREQVGAPQSPMITPILTSDAARALQAHVEASGGSVSEIILMDNLGMNVAVSSVTSDFWQGDEAKFQQTYSVGSSAIHIGEIEFDESSQTYQVQVSFTISDGSGTPMGAATIGLNAEMF